MSLKTAPKTTSSSMGEETRVKPATSIDVAAELHTKPPMTTGNINVMIVQTLRHSDDIRAMTEVMESQAELQVRVDKVAPAPS